MTLSDLLPRAASLAPEWCRPGRGGFKIGSHPFIQTGSLTDADRALVLFAVLKECERRGLRFGVSCTDGAWSGYIFPEPPQDPMEPWVAIYKNDSDPATAALSAFVALLEAEQEADHPESFGEAGK